MKKQISFFGVLWFFFCILLVGCKKHYIEKHYTGTFEFTDEYEWWQMYQPTFDTTVVYTGTVTVIDEDDFKLKIQYLSSSSVIVVVNHDGSFVPQTYLHGGLHGGFKNDDELEFTYSDGGLGGGSTHKVKGVRK